ncbi:MAG: DUF4143 domain-containing protein [Bacteroidia bacterium]
MFEKLLQTLALQVGSETSYNKLAEVVGSDISTVQRYRLLEKSFIIFRLPAFSRNLRTELKKAARFIFMTMVSNAVIGDYRLPELRTDIGGLWENFLISERHKRNVFHRFYGKTYFWRTVSQQEIDYLEEYDGGLHAYEFKWNAKKQPRLPGSFLEAYPGTSLKVVNPENYQAFLAPGEF